MLFSVSVNNRAATYLDQYKARDMLTLARECESLGFSHAWVHDNIIGNSGYEAISSLSAICAATETIKIGTSILIPYYRNPILLSEQISTIDHISNGRLIVGFGAGGIVKNTLKERQELFGAVRVNANDLLEEYILALKSLWRERQDGTIEKSAVSFKGKYIRFEDVMISYGPLQLPHPPIWVASGTFHNGRYFGRFDLVSKLADGWFTLRATPEEIKRTLRQISELRRRYQNSRPFVSCIEFWYAQNHERERAKTLCKEAISKYLGKTVNDDTVSRWSLFGNSQDIVEKVEEYKKAGIDSIKIISAAEDQIRSVQTFAKDIMTCF